MPTEGSGTGEDPGDGPGAGEGPGTGPVSGPVSVRDNPRESRYEVRSGETLAGIVSYRLRPGEVVFDHTETEPGYSGRGLARVLVAEALDDVRRRGLAVLPFCPFVAAFIAKNPSYLHLVPADRRESFGLRPGGGAPPGDR